MVRFSSIALGACLVVPAAALAQSAPTGVSSQVAAPSQPGGRGGISAAPMPIEIVRVDPAFDRIVAPGTKMETLATGFDSTEGPMWHDGKLWVSDQKGGQIYAVDDKGNKTVIAEAAGGPVDPASRVNQGPNGEVPYKDGAALICRQGYRDIARMNKDGSFTAFLSNYQGKRFNSPNDLVYTPDGALWFTDPPFSLPGGRGADNPNRQLPWSAVFRYKDGKLTPMITDMQLPNGIGFSPDGKTLYVSNSGPAMFVRAYDVAADGTLSNPRVFFHWDPSPNGFRSGVPDGLKIDLQGNVWATGVGGVNVISPQGKLLGRLQGPGHTSNVAFGGPDGRTVFVTGGEDVFRVKTLVRGETPLYARK